MTGFAAPLELLELKGCVCTSRLHRTVAWAQAVAHRHCVVVDSPRYGFGLCLNKQYNRSHPMLGG